MAEPLTPERVDALIRDGLDVEVIEGALTEFIWAQGSDFSADEYPAMAVVRTWSETRAALRGDSDGGEADLPSEYGRLLAERDRLIADGADPDDLKMPLPPPGDSDGG